MRLCLSDGSKVTLLESDGEQAVLLSPQPAPSGTPLMIRNDTGAEFQLKVNRCQKSANPGEFRIEARWVTLSRKDKAWLELLLRQAND